MFAAFVKDADPDISIHAPAKGATSFPTISLMASQFQSTHPRRVRLIVNAVLPVPVRLFQSTHPRRVRRHLIFVRAAYSVISIHAPAKGATVSRGQRHNSRHRISIHAPAKGATATELRTSSATLNFNPRTREGCDIICLANSIKLRRFQSTHPRRVRHR